MWQSMDIWNGAPVGPRLGSRIYTRVQSSIIFVLIVVNTNEVTDHPIGAISDYIAVLALTKPRLLDGCGRLPSIFDLMASACTTEKTDSITAGDLAYLPCALQNLSPTGSWIAAVSHRKHHDARVQRPVNWRSSGPRTTNAAACAATKASTRRTRG